MKNQIFPFLAIVFFALPCVQEVIRNSATSREDNTETVEHIYP
ncbi:hypothetical protein [Pedobacter sp. R-06]